ncbi:MAG TPA: RNA 3'-terminal phosphate cyclase [Burkholderiales bacterium]|nr:RNA 3'-terminal phosphate cyclase [Burkholderiales bacterium]
MIEVDGSFGEGDGQLVRTAVALSALTGKGLRIARVRAKRARPGLAPQHLAAVRAREAFLRDIPIGRVARPEEIAPLIAFLASARNSYISGIAIDGGATRGA